MGRLIWSSDLKESVVIQDTLTSDEAISVLCFALLGEDYYIADPVSGTQANAIIVRDILKKYAPRTKYKRGS